METASTSSIITYGISLCAVIVSAFAYKAYTSKMADSISSDEYEYETPLPSKATP